MEFRGSSPELRSKIEKINGVSEISEQLSDEGTTTYKIISKPNVDVRPEITKTIVNENLELLEIKYISMTLEQIFINITMN